MRTYDNSTTVSLHITDRCNLRCPHCYMKDFSGYENNINIKKAFESVKVLNPKTLIIYGGEPMLYPNIINQIFDEFENNMHVVVTTNGTIWNKEIYDRAYIIMVTLESFFFNYSKNRTYTRSQYNNLIKLIDTYKDKLILTHNLYPKNNDPFYDRMIKLTELNSNPYPIVDFCEEADFEPNILQEYNTNLNPLLVPKLRVLPDGTITKDMRGVYNICKDASEWKEEYRNQSVPSHDKCKKCEYQYTCPSYKMFPHFCKDVLDKIDDPHFCKIARWKNNEFKN